MTSSAYDYWVLLRNSLNDNCVINGSDTGLCVKGCPERCLKWPAVIILPLSIELLRNDKSGYGWHIEGCPVCFSNNALLTYWVPIVVENH